VEYVPAPQWNRPDGVSLGGMNVLISSNDVHIRGNQNDSSGMGLHRRRCLRPASYYAYTGNIQINNKYDSMCC